MKFVTVKAPPSRVAASGKLFELLDASLWLVTASQTVQIVSDHLIEALAESVRLLARPRNHLLVDGQRQIHWQSIRAHVKCVN